MIDMVTLNQRLSEVMAEPRANVAVIAILATIAVMLILLLVLIAFAALSSRRKSEEYVTRGTDGRRYLVVESHVSDESNPRQQRYVILAFISFAASLLTAYLAWSPLA